MDNNSNFPLGSRSAMAVRDVLVEDLELLRSWAEIKDYFLSSPSEQLQIENMMQNCIPMQDIVLKTLTLWINNHGNSATFNSCVEILLGRRYLKVAEILMSKRQLIKLGMVLPVPQIENIWYHVGAPCHRFTGRLKELNALHEMLTHNDVGSKSVSFESRLAVISGLGGVGKTTLARAFAHKFKSSYRNVIWVNAETKESMSKSFRGLAQHLGFSDEEIIKLVEKVFLHFLNTKCLFIFDNAEDFKGIDGIFNFFPTFNLAISKDPPYIIVTTRRLDLFLGSEILQLDVLTKQEAVEFIQSWLKLEQNSEELERLVEMLHMLPLALEQAAAYIARLELLRGQRKWDISPVATYIKHYEGNAEKILNNETFQKLTLSTYEKTTLVTWNNTFDKIQNCIGGPLAITLMEMIAYLGSDNIPVQLLFNLRRIELSFSSDTPTSIFEEKEYITSTDKPMHDSRNCLSKAVPNIFKACFKQEEEVTNGRNADMAKNAPVRAELGQKIKCEDNADVDEGLDLLKSYSMLTEVEDGLCVHRVVQQVVQISAGIDKERKILRTGVNLFESTFDPLNGNPEFSRMQARCVEHSAVFLKHFIRHDELVLEFSGFAPKVCRKLDMSGNYEEINSLTTTLLCPRYNSLFGHSHPASIELIRCYALSLKRLYRYNEALDVVDTIFPVATEALGCTHSLVLDLQNIKATVLLHLEKYEDANTIFDNILPVYTKEEGEMSANVVTVLHNKSGCLAGLGRHAAAAETYKHVYRIRQEMYEKDHPFTLSTKHSLAVELLYDVEGKISPEAEAQRNEALKLFQEVHEKFRETLGEEHHFTLSTGNSIAFALLKKGDENERAEEMLEQTLKVHTAIFGTDNRLTLLVKHNLAVAVAQQGRYEEALPIFEEVALVSGKVDGTTNFLTKRALWWAEKVKQEIHKPIVK